MISSEIGPPCLSTYSMLLVIFFLNVEVMKSSNI